jgi:sugar phosphate isomerase/epimerase
MRDDSSVTRREALALLGVAGLGGLGGWRWPVAYDRLGVQLYTVRSALSQDFEGTLKALGAIGFNEVETHDYFGRTPAQVRAALDAAGLRAAAAHVSLETLERDLPRLLDEAGTVGHRWIVVPYLGGPFRSSDGYARAGEALSRAAEQAAAAGIRVAYHNHDFEFADVEGRTGMDRLLAASSPQVAVELDVYWIVRAGGDPFAFIARHADRVRLLHLKDAGPAPERTMLDVGAGTIDWKALLTAAERAGVAHVFVEHDRPSDPLASVRASHDHLRRVLRG